MVIDEITVLFDPMVTLNLGSPIKESSKKKLLFPADFIENGFPCMSFLDRRAGDLRPWIQSQDKQCGKHTRAFQGKYKLEIFLMCLIIDIDNKIIS